MDFPKRVQSFCYQYEASYKGSSVEDQHRPDFRIKANGDQSIWIEYFGIDRQNSVSPDVSATEYLKGIDWKKNVHKRNNTILIDLYYYDLKEGNLLNKLEAALSNHGVSSHPKTSKEIVEQANKSGYQTQFLKICNQFLTHVRAKGFTSLELKRMSQRNYRTGAFVAIFNELLSKYELELENQQLPDFAELIHSAADKIRTGEFNFKYKHVLIDEFQDISTDRNELLQAMRCANPGLEITTVGDDWQSIYRFSGSDISIMRAVSRPRFRRKRVDLTSTSRLPQVIADISREFVLRNPLQIQKRVVSKSPIKDAGSVVTHWDVTQENIIASLEKIIEGIGADSKDLKVSLRIIARYSNNLPSQYELRNLWKGPIDVGTIHSSKGLEADYVIVTDLIQDNRGFPSTIQDDPVMSLVMPEKDLYIHGEERRLFYVALTRAKKETHLISPLSSPSVFTQELFKSNLGNHIGR
jgi:DNA helicase-4